MATVGVKGLNCWVFAPPSVGGRLMVTGKDTCSRRQQGNRMLHGISCWTAAVCSPSYSSRHSLHWHSFTPPTVILLFNSFYSFKCKQKAISTYTTLHWLPVRRRVEFKLTCARHCAVKCLSTWLMTSISSSSDNMCAVPRTHNSFGDRSFGASLPRGLRTLDISYKHFKALLKTYMFRQGHGAL